jgi:alcohol dehydrogenase class IV
LDTGKGINILMNNPGSLENYLVVSDPLPVIKPGVPLILLPTTAGTGSEVSTAGVYTNAAGVKRGAYISGTFAVVDPELAVSLPASVTAGCGMDAFAHAAENLVSIFESEFDKMLDFDAIKRIMKWLPVTVQDGKDIEARSQMGFAASMAILGGCSTGLNINHACAHTLGAAFHLPHGDLCGICLPETTRRNAKVAPQKVRTLGEAMGIHISPQASPVEIGETVAQAITDFLRKVGVKSLKAHGIKRDDIVNRGSELSKTMAGDPCMVTAPTKDLPSESYDDIWVKFYDDYQ